MHTLSLVYPDGTLVLLYPFTMLQSVSAPSPLVVLCARLNRKGAHLKVNVESAMMDPSGLPPLLGHEPGTCAWGKGKGEQRNLQSSLQFGGKLSV